MKKVSWFLVIGWLLLAACSTTGRTNVTVTPSAQPTPTVMKVIPTASSPGNSIVWDNLQVTVDQFEVSGEYLTDFGSTRIPPEGGKFLWVRVLLKNTGSVQMEVPLSEHYSVLYAAAELKPTYGHRDGYTDYTSLGTLIFPGQNLDGWLRFDIPATAGLNELLFVFLPESVQVGTSYSSPDYPYAEDKPTYVWTCVP